ncbi:MAG TPA: signal peptidase II [Thermoanaerobaculia bacterium]|nr:signal peptidase II [Thermoanaerobaculia bacterium]
MMTRWRLALLLLVMLWCVGCDQAAKAVARGSLAERGTVSLFGGAVRFQYAENTGAFLSLGASLPRQLRSLLFVGGTGVIVVILLVTMARAGQASLLSSLGLALLAGGAMGNLIDRVAYGGAVVDFVSVGFGSFRTGIFNLADVAITLGVVLVAVQGWRSPDNPQPG